MSIAFRFEALSKDIFQSLLELNEEELACHNARWLAVDSNPGYPCRVSLEDAKVGERVLALSYMYHDVPSPYRASGPIFVRENANTKKSQTNEVPNMLRHRLLSVRGYNSTHFMIDAQVVQGTELENIIEKQFGNGAIEYLHIHNANPGCFNCAVYRA